MRSGLRARGGFLGDGGRRQRHGLERLLSIFGDVRRGEGVTSLLLTAHVFFLLLAYYLIKTAREPLILETGGAELKAYTSAGQVLLLVPVAKGYDLLTRRFGRMRLIPIVTLFFASHLPVFYLLSRLGVPYLGFAFYVWVGVFSLVMVAQFWSFANDIYDEDQGKRLFPLVAGGSAAGAVVGAYGAALLPVGPYTIMLMTAGLLVLNLGLTYAVHRREANGERAQGSDGQAPRPPSFHADRPIGGKDDAFALILRDPYLLLIAGLTLVRNWVNTTGEYILDRSVLELARSQLEAGTIHSIAAYIQGFKGTFYGTVNLAELVLQFFVVSRVMKLLGVRAALLVLPLFALGGYAAMAAMTTLAVIAVAKVAENSVDYSLQNTAQHTLFLWPSREAKYKAKAVIDTLVWRGGDLLAAAVIFAGNNWFAFTTRDFILVNVVMLTVWIAVVLALGRVHARTEAAAQQAAVLRAATASGVRLAFAESSTPSTAQAA